MLLKKTRRKRSKTTRKVRKKIARIVKVVKMKIKVRKVIRRPNRKIMLTRIRRRLKNLKVVINKNLRKIWLIKKQNFRRRKKRLLKKM
jgi:hypothetical protein